LSGRGLCDGLITRPEEPYRLWRVVLYDQETSNEEAKARYGAVKNTTRRAVTPRKLEYENTVKRKEVQRERESRDQAENKNN
jgi:hypothetical protein